MKAAELCGGHSGSAADDGDLLVVVESGRCAGKRTEFAIAAVEQAVGVQHPADEFDCGPVSAVAEHGASLAAAVAVVRFVSANRGGQCGQCCGDDEDSYQFAHRRRVVTGHRDRVPRCDCTQARKSSPP